MTKSLIRLQYVFQGEDTSVHDNDALIETLVVRKMERLHGRLGKNALKSWVFQALKNQYLLESGNMPQGVAMESILPALGAPVSRDEPAERKSVVENGVPQKSTEAQKRFQGAM
jgi:hypothetical protein